MSCVVGRWSRACMRLAEKAQAAVRITVMTSTRRARRTVEPVIAYKQSRLTTAHDDVTDPEY